MALPSAPALTRACRTRTNCRMWGSSPVNKARAGPAQSPPATGSAGDKLMWEPAGPGQAYFQAVLAVQQAEPVVVGDGGLQLLAGV